LGTPELTSLARMSRRVWRFVPPAKEINVTFDDLQAFVGHADATETIAENYLPPAPYWETKVPPYHVKALHAPLALFDAPNGQTLGFITGGHTMDVHERQGGWLRVVKPPATIFWVMANGVTPIT
jgi:hypothetical protein